MQVNKVTIARLIVGTYSMFQQEETTLHLGWGDPNAAVVSGTAAMVNTQEPEGVVSGGPPETRHKEQGT